MEDFLNFKSGSCDTCRYQAEKDGNRDIGDFRQWIHQSVTSAIYNKEVVSNTELDLAIGPQPRGEFMNALWAYGRHFRVRAKDTLKKTTMDSGISATFQHPDRTQEYFGLVDSIVRLNFDSFSTVLIKGKWYDSVEESSRRRGTVVLDECGFMRVRAQKFMPDNRMTDEPFMFPKDLEQVFYLDDKLNRGWKIVIPVHTRSKRVFFSKSRFESSAEEDVDVDDEVQDHGETSNILGERVHVSLSGVEADDSAGEDPLEHEEDAVDFDDVSLEVDNRSLSSDDVGDYDREVLPEFSVGTLRLEEIEDLQSDGELEVTQE